MAEAEVLVQLSEPVLLGCPQDYSMAVRRASQSAVLQERAGYHVAGVSRPPEYLVKDCFGSIALSVARGDVDHAGIAPDQKQLRDARAA